MNKHVELIVSRCTRTGDRVIGECLIRSTFPTVRAASHDADAWLQPGFSVVVRPNYNETDSNGKRFFREWRSFNGEPLRPVVFTLNM